MALCGSMKLTTVILVLLPAYRQLKRLTNQFASDDIFGHCERLNDFSYILFDYLGVNHGSNFDCVITLSNLDELLRRFAGECIVRRCARHLDLKLVKTGEAIA